jgi:hypothetical protein
MSACWNVLVDEIPIRVMLHIEAIPTLVPVIEDLAAQNVTSDTPRRLITFLDKVLVGEELRESLINE